MLFVENDEPNVISRREHGGPSADDDVTVLAAQSFPVVVALTNGKLTVEYHHFIAKGFDKALHNLVGEDNFRYQHHRNAVRFQTRLGGFHVNACLATTRNTVKQESFVLPVPNGLRHRFVARFLLRIEVDFFLQMRLVRRPCLAVSLFDANAVIIHNLLNDWQAIAIGLEHRHRRGA